MSNPNIVTITTMTGNTDVLNVSTSMTAITSNGSGSGTVSRINTLLASNKSANAVTVSVELYRATVSYPIVTTISISPGSVFAIIGKDTPVYLQEGDQIRMLASAGSSIVGICSYETLS